MTVRQEAYSPLFPSERLTAGFMGQPPFIGCSISTAQVITAWATLGECQIKPNGRPWDRDDFANQQKVGLRAFTKVADSNGIPDRDDADRIHDAMFPGLPDLIPLVSRDFDEVVERAKDDNAISIAVFLPAMPADAVICKYTRAPHQIPLVNKDGELKKGRLTVQDGMHQPQLSWGGHQVPLLQIQKAAKSFPDSPGLVMAWRVPIGGWTQEALAKAGLQAQLRARREDIEELNVNLTARNREIRRLEALLAQQPQPQPGIEAARAAGWEAALVGIKKDADRRRAEGPPPIGGQ